MSGILRVENWTMNAAERRLAALGQDLAGAAEPVERAGELALAGAGEFAGDLDQGIVTFVLSWRAVLDLFGDSATAVSRQAGQTLAELGLVDRTLIRLLGTR